MNFQDFLPSPETFSGFLENLNWPKVVGLLVFALIGFTVLGIIRRAVQRIVRKRADEHTGLLVGRLVFYLGTVLLLLTILHEANFKLGALLGAAGIVSLAIGFAAQTGLSNIISAIFLYWERPFKVGDLVRIDDTTGVVMSIDLTSIKLRKLDNVFVRIPNENVLKTSLENITRHPIRRMDINVGCAYKDDPARVIKVLREIAEANPHVLDEPEPLVLFQEFGDSSLNFLLGAWFEKSQFVAVRNSLLCDIKTRFDAEGIEIPFPHRSLYTGEATAPFPIRIVGPGEGSELPGLPTGLPAATTERAG